MGMFFFHLIRHPSKWVHVRPQTHTSGHFYIGVPPQPQTPGIQAQESHPCRQVQVLVHIIDAFTPETTTQVYCSTTSARTSDPSTPVGSSLPDSPPPPHPHRPPLVPPPTARCRVDACGRRPQYALVWRGARYQTSKHAKTSERPPSGKTWALPARNAEILRDHAMGVFIY